MLLLEEDLENLFFIKYIEKTLTNHQIEGAYSCKNGDMISELDLKSQQI